MSAIISKRQITTVLALCLCAHGFLLMSVVTVGLPVTLEQIENEIPHHADEEREEWVAMHGYGFGAPVMFASPEFQPESPLNSDQSATKNENNNMVTHDHQKQVDKDNEQNTQTVHAVQTVLKPQHTSSTTKEDQKNSSEDQPPQTQELRAQAPTSPSDHLTFAKLATGFMQYMKNPAHIPASVAVVSNKKGTVSDKQLAQMNFDQKILKCIVNSYQIHRLEAPRYLQKQRAAVVLSLNRDGSINTVGLLHSSGIPEIDRFVVAFFKDTEGSLPPVPQQFPDPYQMPVITFDDVRLFQSPEYWYYQATN